MVDESKKKTNVALKESTRRFLERKEWVNEKKGGRSTSLPLDRDEPYWQKHADQKRVSVE